MAEPVATRVVEISPGEWIVQFEGGLSGWVQLNDETFSTQKAAEAFLQNELDNADFGDEE